MAITAGAPPLWSLTQQWQHQRNTKAKQRIHKGTRMAHIAMPTSAAAPAHSGAAGADHCAHGTAAHALSTHTKPTNQANTTKGHNHSTAIHVSRPKLGLLQLQCRAG
jgi:hypothetical protein